MIHTKNISVTVKNLENKLNKEMGSNIQKIFTVENQPNKTDNSDGLIQIQIYWCLRLAELNKIETIIGDSFYITKGNNQNMLCIWTTYKEEG